MKQESSAKPRFRPELRFIDRVLDALVLLSLVVLWTISFKAYQQLPTSIVVHFDAAGQPDGFGHKWSILIMPGLATVLAISMFVINRFPYIFNYPVKITPENALFQYTMATRLMRWINLLTTILLGMVNWMMIASASGHFSKLWIAVILVFTVLMFVPFIIYMVIASRKK
ncbi:MAG: hypothetical protein PWR20_1497 [Bacteroidales bacterium]|jgi:hypothetical protein|nr:hypothetical protein [Bacteroidales bacterium]MDN5330286.1 hypothetical protein [Bacteroidales bacterium]